MRTPRFGTLAAATLCLALASCQPLRDELLAEQRVLELAPGETIHVVLTPNATAIAQGDAGVHVSASALSPGRARLEIVADDPTLDALIGTEIRDLPDGSTSLHTGVGGGDLRALCADLDPCELGFTLALTEAPEPTMVHLRIGVARRADRGLFGGSQHFEASAAIEVRVE